MTNFRTSCIFRFSKEFSSIKKVIKSGIIPNYCEEDLSFDDKQIVIGIPMACFCDIPLTLMEEQNKRYGEYGIGLTKEWALKNEIAPVMYIANDIDLKPYCYINQNIENTSAVVNSKAFSEEYRRKTIFQGFPVAMYIQTLELEKEQDLCATSVRCFKKYEGQYKNKPINNYLENEWRYIVLESEKIKWKWSKEEYESWRFPSGIKNKKKPAPSSELKEFTLTFTPEDVKYILVKDDDSKSKMIEYIKTLQMFGGSTPIADKDRYDIISKIITMKQVQEDF